MTHVCPACEEQGEFGMHERHDDFTLAPTEAVIQDVAKRQRERNIEVVVIDGGEQAREVVLERLPLGAEVHSARSKTLEDTGIYEAIHDPTRFGPLRPRYITMDRRTQGRAIRKLVASPDYMVGSVNAVTRDGQLVVASASGSQLGPYSGAAGKVILVVGSQKIVPDLEAALRRIRVYALEEEDRQARAAGNLRAFVGKALIIEREWEDGRMTVVLVRKPVGV